MCEHQEKPLADWVRDGAPIWSNSRLMTTKEAAGAGPTGSRGQHLTLSSSNQRAEASEGIERIRCRCRQPFTVRSQASLLSALAGRPGCAPPAAPLLVQLPGRGEPPKEVTHGGAGTLLSLGLFICRKAGVAGAPQRGHCPVSAPRQGLLLSLNEATPPSAPQSKGQSSSASRLDPTLRTGAHRGLWSLVSMASGEGTGPTLAE